MRALAKRHYRIRVAVRRPELAGHLQPLGRVGQIHAVQANVRHPGSVGAAARGADVVVNLIGILFERGRQRFDIVQAHGAEQVARAANAHGARMIQISAIGADANSTSAYARTKADGEQALVRAATPNAVIVRPSIMFGPEDDFFNRFGAMARLLPALPLVGGGETRFQPVFVGDVAEAIARAVDGEAKAGTTYEAGGPEVRSFKQLMEYVLATTERRRLLIPLPFAIAQAPGHVPSVPAEAAAHPRPGRDAADRQRGLRGRPARAPHPAGARHRACRDGGGRAVVPLALPQDWAVQDWPLRLTQPALTPHTLF